MHKWRVRGLAVDRPSESPFPFLLRNICGPETFQRQPCTVGLNSALPRDGIPKPKHVAARCKLNRSHNGCLYQKDNYETGNIDIRNHESRCEPRFGEGLHVKSGRTQAHSEIDEVIQRAEDPAEYRTAVGSLEE